MTVTTNSTAGAAPAPEGSDFFRYHGAWAPGVRLFRNVRFRTKAWIISAAFLVPLATVVATLLVVVALGHTHWM